MALAISPTVGPAAVRGPKFSAARRGRIGGQRRRIQQIAAEAIQHVLPGTARFGIAQRQPLARARRVHHVRHQPAGREIAAADDVAGARGADRDAVRAPGSFAPLPRSPVPWPPWTRNRDRGRRADHPPAAPCRRECRRKPCRWSPPAPRPDAAQHAARSASARCPSTLMAKLSAGSATERCTDVCALMCSTMSGCASATASATAVASRRSAICVSVSGHRGAAARTS